MCYGSGCDNETYQGECSYIGIDAENLINNSVFPSTCVVYGCIHEIMNFYLTKEEQLEMERQWNSNEYDNIATTEHYEALAYNRWRDDKDRLGLINKLNKL